jgi:DNA invertase Pin-like site-specific DNA recombinase
VDTRGATGRLTLNMFAAMAQFERQIMLERHRGIAKAKAQGKVQGSEAHCSGEGTRCASPL